jgi:hypothetical protein
MQALAGTPVGVVAAFAWDCATDPERVTALAGDAQQTYDAALQGLSARRGQASVELERVGRRLGSLLELAEDRLVTKQEYAPRRA